MPHALLVDDNRDTLDALTEVLKAEGFTASTAPNLDEAKAALLRQMPGRGAARSEPARTGAA
jgi:DNA-binding response OmpR family regulator